MCGGGIASVGGGAATGGATKARLVGKSALTWITLTLHFVTIRYARRRALFRPPARQRSGGLILKRVAVLIDGGHLRIAALTARVKYEPDLIEKVAVACVSNGEDLFRAFYYDCPLFNGTRKLPVSGANQVFNGDNEWLNVLASKELFAIRLGTLKFRGYKPKKSKFLGRALTDADFKPDFEQKGVDMRIGLDIANFCVTKAVDRIVLITNDTDCIPAMKYGRRAGLQIILMSLPGQATAPELLHHADIHRKLGEWPKPAKSLTPSATPPAPAAPPPVSQPVAGPPL